jgi:hypothetical protein
MQHPSFRPADDSRKPTPPIAPITPLEKSARATLPSPAHHESVRYRKYGRRRGNHPPKSLPLQRPPAAAADTIANKWAC